jgi:hypothetical protein
MRIDPASAPGFEPQPGMAAATPSQSFAQLLDGNGAAKGADLPAIPGFDPPPQSAAPLPEDDDPARQADPPATGGLNPQLGSSAVPAPQTFLQLPAGEGAAKGGDTGSIPDAGLQPDEAAAQRPPQSAGRQFGGGAQAARIEAAAIHEFLGKPGIAAERPLPSPAPTRDDGAAGPIASTPSVDPQPAEAAGQPPARPLGRLPGDEEAASIQSPSALRVAAEPDMASGTPPRALQPPLETDGAAKAIDAAPLPGFGRQGDVAAGLPAQIPTPPAGGDGDADAQTVDTASIPRPDPEHGVPAGTSPQSSAQLPDADGATRGTGPASLPGLSVEPDQGSPPSPQTSPELPDADGAAKGSDLPSVPGPGAQPGEAASPPPQSPAPVLHGSKAPERAFTFAEFGMFGRERLPGGPAEEAAPGASPARPRLALLPVESLDLPPADRAADPAASAPPAPEPGQRPVRPETLREAAASRGAAVRAASPKALKAAPSPATPAADEEDDTGVAPARRPSARPQPRQDVSLILREQDGGVELVAAAPALDPEIAAALRRLARAILARSGLELAHFQLNGVSLAPDSTKTVGGSHGTRTY